LTASALESSFFSISLSGRSARKEQRRLDAIFEDLLRVCNVWRGACDLEGSDHEGEDGGPAATGCGEAGVRKQCGQRLRLADTARRNAVAAARAVLVQSRADEKRYAVLVKDGLAVSSQTLMGHSYRVIRRMRYGTDSTRERHNDGAAVFRVKGLEGATACDP
jgi:hypothetical protein